MVVGGGEMVEGESVISMNPVPEKNGRKVFACQAKNIEIMESRW